MRKRTIFLKAGVGLLLAASLTLAWRGHWVASQAAQAEVATLPASVLAGQSPARQAILTQAYRTCLGRQVLQNTGVSQAAAGCARDVTATGPR